MTHAQVIRLANVDQLKKLTNVLRPVSQKHEGEAAVALILKTVDRDVKVLFVKRVENSTDPWSGQIAFPGGKRDVKDRNLKQTVVRETLEETNIDLLDCCHFLGVMRAIRSTQRPDMNVLPYVALLKYEPSIKLSEKELEEFFWISLKELIRHKSTVEVNSQEVLAYVVGRLVIWGLTYRIVEGFVQIFTSLQ